jgi:hypothetical protein
LALDSFQTKHIYTLSNSRFDRPFFRDSTIQREIASVGYSVRPCLSKIQTTDLLAKCEQLIRLLPEGLPDSFCPSGRFDNPAFRTFAKNAIENVVPSALEPFFIEPSASLMGRTFLIKPPGPNTSLDPYQDSSHVDESGSFSIYAWIPLVDTSIENGAFHVFPSSHLCGNKHRSLNVPWCFTGHVDDLLNLSTPILVTRGEVCFFEGALVHSSPPNKTESSTVGLNYFIKPKSQQFLHHYVNEETPTGKVEVYGVDVDFFYSEDFESRPPKKLLLRYEYVVNQEVVKEPFRKILRVLQNANPRRP